jgi:predicted nucleic acid-binding protein
MPLVERVARCRPAVSVGVVDSSIGLTWCFEDEASPETDRLFERVRDDGAMVPGLRYLELGNVLPEAEKRGPISPVDVALRLSLIAGSTDLGRPGHNTSLARNTIACRAEVLTTYAAAYLELAIRRGMALLTRDSDLADAAKRNGIIVLP